jgi:hypothetical protein
MTPTPQSWLTFLLPFAVIAVVLTLRMRRMATLRPLRVQSLWIVPAVYLAIAAIVFWATPPRTPMVWLSCAAALVVGAGLGWQRGRMMHISLDPASGSLRHKGSIAAMVFIVVLIALRTAAREAVQLGGLPVDVRALTDVLVALALGLLSLQRLEMFLRARRLLTGPRRSA